MGKLTKDHNLQKVNPELAKQWHPKKNAKLKPRDVTPGSSKHVWWLCEKGHEWKAVVYERNRGSGCPSCSGRKQMDTEEWRKPLKSTKRGKSAWGSTVRKVGETSTGNILVEMPRKEWERFCSLTAPPEDLGAAIVQYRKKRGLSQGAFAEIVGHSRNWISAIERDRSLRMSYETYKRIISTISSQIGGHGNL